MCKKIDINIKFMYYFYCKPFIEWKNTNTELIDYTTEIYKEFVKYGTPILEAAKNRLMKQHEKI